MSYTTDSAPRRGARLMRSSDEIAERESWWLSSTERIRGRSSTTACRARPRSDLARQIGSRAGDLISRLLHRADQVAVRLEHELLDHVEPAPLDCESQPERAADGVGGGGRRGVGGVCASTIARTAPGR